MVRRLLCIWRGQVAATDFLVTRQAVRRQGYRSVVSTIYENRAVFAECPLHECKGPLLNTSFSFGKGNDEVDILKAMLALADRVNQVPR